MGKFSQSLSGCEVFLFLETAVVQAKFRNKPEVGRLLWYKLDIWFRSIVVMQCSAFVKQREAQSGTFTSERSW